MPPELMTCLNAYSPEFICPKCLTFIVEQDETIVTRALNGLVIAGQVEAGYAMCVECGSNTTVMRVSPRKLQAS